MHMEEPFYNFHSLTLIDEFYVKEIIILTISMKTFLTVLMETLELAYLWYLQCKIYRTSKMKSKKKIFQWNFK